MIRRVYFSVIFPFILLFSFFLPPFLEAQEENPSLCAECSLPIGRNNYFKMNNQIFCSKKCVQARQKKLLPKCSICKKSTQRFWQTAHSGERRCDACKNLPRCSFCADHVIEKNNGRLLCARCARTAIRTPEKAHPIFLALRKRLKNSFGIGTDHHIHFSLVSQKEMRRRKGSPLDTNQTGLFLHRTQMRSEHKYNRRTGRTISRKVTLTGETFSICILAALPPPVYRHTVIHELTHDWMSQFCPHIEDLKIKEGVCEYVAWLFLKYDREKLFLSFLECTNIEQNPDPVYGGGFRMIRKIAGSDDPHKCIARLKKYLKR